MDIIITDILANGDVSTAKILSEVFKKFGDTFRDPEDVNILMGLLTDEVIQRNLGALSKTISSIEPKHIEGKTTQNIKCHMYFIVVDFSQTIMVCFTFSRSFQNFWKNQTREHATD